jgi:gliding motility-associated-like protein
MLVYIIHWFKKNNAPANPLLLVKGLLLMGLFFCNQTNAQVGPTATIAVVGAATVCKTAVGTINFTALTGSPPFTFTYSVNGGTPTTISTGPTNFSVPLTNSGTVGVFTYSLIAVSDVNFPTPQLASGSATLTFDPLPTAVAGGTSGLYCSNKVITLPAGAANATNGTINWTENGAGVIASGQNSLTPSYQAVVSDTGRNVVLTMTVISNNACYNIVPPAQAQAIHILQIRNAIRADMTIPNNACNNAAELIIFRAYTGITPYFFYYTIDGGPVQMANTLGTNTVTTAPLNTSTSDRTYLYNLDSIRDGNCTQAITKNVKKLVIGKTPIATALDTLIRACRDDYPYPEVKFLSVVTSVNPYTITYTIDGILQKPKTLSIVDTLKFPISTNQAGRFIYKVLTMKDGYGCPGIIDSSTTIVKVAQHPSARFAIKNDLVTDLRPIVSFVNYSVDGEQWLWDFDDGYISTFENPGQHTYKDTGKYTVKLKVFNETCVDSTSQDMRVYKPITMYVPNSFSPNNDRVNDVFYVKGDGFEDFDIRIFDRWGELVFSTSDINEGWDGRINGEEITQESTFVWVLRSRDLDLKSYIRYGTLNAAPK